MHRHERRGPPAARLEHLIPGINMRGFTEEKPGLLVSPNRSSPYETHPIASPMIESFWHILKSGNDKRNIKLWEDLSRFLRGKVVVDIGAGYQHKFGYEIAELCGAAGYVAVEPYHYGHFRRHFDYGGNRLPYAVVAEDMRSFIPRLPNNSVCFLISGIDESILYGIPDRDYQNLNVGITRALDPRGALVSHESILHGKGLTKYPLNHYFEGNSFDGLHVLTKR